MRQRLLLEMEKSVGIIKPFTAFLLLLLVFSCILGFLSEHLSLLQLLQISSKLLTNNTRALYTEVWVNYSVCVQAYF